MLTLIAPAPKSQVRTYQLSLNISLWSGLKEHQPNLIENSRYTSISTWQINFLQVFCFKTIEPPPPLLIEGLNFVRIWLFGLAQSSFVGLAISRMYLMYKVNKQYLKRMLSSYLHSFTVFQMSMTVCESNALTQIHHLIWITFKMLNHFYVRSQPSSSNWTTRKSSQRRSEPSLCWFPFTPSWFLSFYAWSIVLVSILNLTASFSSLPVFWNRMVQQGCYSSYFPFVSLSLLWSWWPQRFVLALFVDQQQQLFSQHHARQTLSPTQFHS